MGFPKGALASPLVKGEVKTLPAKWLRLLTLDGGFLCDGYYVQFCVKGITELLVIGSQRRRGLRRLT